MDIFDLVASIKLDTSEYEKGIEEAGGEAASFSSGWKKAGKIAVAAIGAATVAVGGLAKESVASYTQYEQLVGGVKKLYGEAADELMSYAEQGYKTSGMSANKYMTLATSFSAALINSLDGDMSAAAKQTDVAMRAISDNFNTFGGDIGMIQGAFQGFAKQNYMMLDNLKLGYGGTKTEMERLIADANEYAKANGMAADLSISSFADVVTAIDLIQQKQGIAGTTAKEAATTIEGAMNMTKAAWENLLTGFASPDADINQLMDNLIVAVVGDKEGTGLLNQMLPAVQRAIDGVGQFLQAAVPALSAQLPSLIESFLPVIIKSAVSLVASIAQALPEIIVTITELLPEIVDSIINGLVDAIIEATPILIKQAPKIVKSLAVGIVKSVSLVTSAGQRLVNSLGSAIGSALAKLGGKVVSLAKKIPEGIKRGLGNLRTIGVNLIEGLWGGIKSKFDGTVEKVKALADKLPKAVKKVLGIASPSKVFKEIGKWIPEGLALGIEDNMKAVYRASDAMTDATSISPTVGAKALGSESGLGGNIIINLNYSNNEDANQLARDIAIGINRYRMAGAI